MNKNNTLEGIRCFLRVSRWKIQLVSLATVLLGPLFAAHTLSDILILDVLLFGLLFYAVVTFSCNINCYHDVEVDSLRKVKLARSVKYLGGKLVFVMGIEVFVSLLLVFLLIIRGHLLVGLLGLFGLALGYMYSASPIRVKSRGIISPLPVNIGVYILPLVAGYLVVKSDISWLFLLFVAGYAVLNLGINLVNVAEDYKEDKDKGIKTISHSMGLSKTISTAVMSLLIGTGIILTVFYVLLRFDLPVIVSFSFGAVTMLLVPVDLLSLFGDVEYLEKKVQRKAKKLPLYFIITRYPMVLFLLILII